MEGLGVITVAEIGAGIGLYRLAEHRGVLGRVVSAVDVFIGVVRVGIVPIDLRKFIAHTDQLQEDLSRLPVHGRRADPFPLGQFVVGELQFRLAGEKLALAVGHLLVVGEISGPRISQKRGKLLRGLSRQSFGGGGEQQVSRLGHHVVDLLAGIREICVLASGGVKVDPGQLRPGAQTHIIVQEQTVQPFRLPGGSGGLQLPGPGAKGRHIVKLAGHIVKMHLGVLAAAEKSLRRRGRARRFRLSRGRLRSGLIRRRSGRLRGRRRCHGSGRSSCRRGRRRGRRAGRLRFGRREASRRKAQCEEQAYRCYKASVHVITRRNCTP